jgi:hypothetical protein
MLCGFCPDPETTDRAKHYPIKETEVCTRSLRDALRYPRPPAMWKIATRGRSNFSPPHTPRFASAVCAVGNHPPEFESLRRAFPTRNKTCSRHLRSIQLLIAHHGFVKHHVPITSRLNAAHPKGDPAPLLQRRRNRYQHGDCPSQPHAVIQEINVDVPLFLDAIAAVIHHEIIPDHFIR